MARHERGIGWKDDIARVRIATEDDTVLPRFDAVLLARKGAGAVTDDQHRFVTRSDVRA